MTIFPNVYVQPAATDEEPRDDVVDEPIADPISVTFPDEDAVDVEAMQAELDRYHLQASSTFTELDDFFVSLGKGDAPSA